MMQSKRGILCRGKERRSGNHGGEQVMRRALGGAVGTRHQEYSEHTGDISDCGISCWNIGATHEWYPPSRREQGGRRDGGPETYAFGIRNISERLRSDAGKAGRFTGKAGNVIIAVPKRHEII